MSITFTNIHRFFPVVAMSLLVNVLLFVGIPNLFIAKAVVADLENIQAVTFLRDAPGAESPEKTKRANPQQPPPEPAKIVTQKAVAPMAHPSIPQLDMSMPSIDFDLPLKLHPSMAMDMASEPSPAAPVNVRPSVARKASYGLLEVDRIPVATLKPRPVYPYRAQRLNLDGEVNVKFLVDTNGWVSRITILKSTPPKLFDRSVTDALATWRFSPGKLRGKPVNTWMTTTIAFRIDDL
jgi:protein TonB